MEVLREALGMFILIADISSRISCKLRVVFLLLRTVFFFSPGFGICSGYDTSVRSLALKVNIVSRIANNHAVPRN